jgi:hypothetical protein
MQARARQLLCRGPTGPKPIVSSLFSMGKVLPAGLFGRRWPLFRNFLDGVVPTARQAKIIWGGEPETDTFGHEPALVACCCSPAKLLGFPKLVGTPRCNDARRCHQCDWHGQGGRAAMASCRTSEQLNALRVCFRCNFAGCALLRRLQLCVFPRVVTLVLRYALRGRRVRRSYGILQKLA